MNEKPPINFIFRSDSITRRIFWCLLGFELFIVFLDITVNYYEWSASGPIRRMVNITREDSLSNWFSSLQAIVVGSVVWLTAFAIRNQKGAHYKKKFYGWAGIGGFFIYVGIDDAIKFHERIGTTFRVRVFEPDDGILGALFQAFPSFSWQVVFGPFLAAIGVFLLWFLWKELSSRKLWYWFLTGISLYVIAVGLDFVEGLDYEAYDEMGIAGFFSTSDFRIRHFSKTLEEFLEMLGTTIFLVIFLKNLFRLSWDWKISIKHD